MPSIFFKILPKSAFSRVRLLLPDFGFGVQGCRRGGFRGLGLGLAQSSLWDPKLTDGLGNLLRKGYNKAES